MLKMMFTTVPKIFTNLCISFAIVLLTTSCLRHTCCSASSIPADHLIPPPLPSPQRLQQAQPSNFNQYFQKAPASTWHRHNSLQNNEPPGFMTRVARWFGFPGDTHPREQQLTANNYQKQTYYYTKPKPNAEKQEPCLTLCNNAPWVPMIVPSIELPLQAFASELNAHKQNAYDESVTQQRLPNSQRSIQFKHPPLPLDYRYQQQAPTAQTLQPHLTPTVHASQYTPVPIPQPEQQLPHFTPQTNNNNNNYPAFVEQQLPSTELAHFTENVGAHSELQINRVIPNAPGAASPVSATTDASGVEIIKSQQISHFVSSVEYPATYVQSETIDVPYQPTVAKNPQNSGAVNDVEIRNLQLLPNPSKHTPASEILTQSVNLSNVANGSSEPNSQAVQNLFDFVPQPVTESHTPPPSPPETTTQPTPHVEYISGDNFPSASTHNAHNVNHTYVLNADSWDSEQNELYYTTVEPPHDLHPPQSSSETEAQSNFVTDHFANTRVEYVPSLEIDVTKNRPTPKPVQFNDWQQRLRETPKRLLDSPIQHIPRDHGQPRPFTNDPSKLSLRLFATETRPHEFQHANHDYTQTTSHKPQQQQQQQQQHNHQQPQNDAWLGVTPPSTIGSFVVAAAPTPTSTYSAIDASGQYAGMSPPEMPQSIQLSQAPPPKKVQQILIPYTTRNRPRPFEVTASVESTTARNVDYNAWSPLIPDVELAQETKLVNEAAGATHKSQKVTTKYLTKILASNLRDLLKHEQAKSTPIKTKSHNFDLSALQKNIDDWTEQEYTSISHLPSTPTIRGRSKYIPSEYFTSTTPATRPAINSHTAALPTSINSLDSDLTDQDTKLSYVSIGDNSILDNFEIRFQEQQNNFITLKTTTTTTTAAPKTKPKTTKHTTEPFIPFYIRALPTANASELWHKAKVSISPQTKEKIYVVTPQPRFFPQRTFTVTTEATPTKSITQNFQSFQSPRFVVRPTPGNSTAATSPSLYTPEIFGLMGLSAYVPEKPIEIIDGNSKVATITTTPKSKPSTRTIQKTNTMSPLPR